MPDQPPTCIRSADRRYHARGCGLARGFGPERVAAARAVQETPRHHDLVAECLSLTVERVDIDRDEVRATWSCASSVFAEPSRGIDTYTVRNGLIARLVTVITQPPTLQESPRDR